MQTTLERNEATLTRDRSTFIGILIHVTSIESVEQHLKEIKAYYPKAKHYCYAYVIGDKSKCSDDGEPSKTAGRPLLELLKKKEMDEALLVVVRYFGGTLLGASRLMSTYLETGVLTIDGADLSQIELKYVYEINLTYSQYDELKRIAKKYSFSLENASYGDTIKLDVLADENGGETLASLFPHLEINVMGKRKVYRR